jgi:hypothetical protein
MKEYNISIPYTMDANIFEMMARHFSVIYYNDIYKNANEVRNKSTNNKSLTEIYCEKLIQYLHVFKATPGVGDSNTYKYYNLMLNNIINDYNARTNSNLKTVDYVELFIKELVNDKFSKAMNMNRRDEFMFKTMGDILSNFTRNIKNNLSIVIDNRCKENLAKFKFMFLEEIKHTKKSLYEDLIKVMTNNKNSNKVSVDEKLKKRLKEVYKNLSELQKKYNSLVAVTKELKKENILLKDQIKKNTNPPTQVKRGTTSSVNKKVEPPPELVDDDEIFEERPKPNKKVEDIPTQVKKSELKGVANSPGKRGSVIIKKVEDTPTQVKKGIVSPIEEEEEEEDDDEENEEESEDEEESEEGEDEDSDEEEEDEDETKKDEDEEGDNLLKELQEQYY